MAGAEVVQSLWIGSRLSSMEQLCICSFLRQGHPFHLYAYQPIENVPAGAEVRPAAEVFPRSEIFTYRRGRGKGNPSAFSNVFRYKLLFERGGWWSDLDMVCLQRLQFSGEHVFGCERWRDRAPTANVALFRAPPGSPLLERCCERVRLVDKSKARWGELGPGLMRAAMHDMNVPLELLPPDVFYPVDYWDVRRLVRPLAVPDVCQAIHLWNSQWRHCGLDPDGRFSSDSLYEQLRRAFLPAGWEQSLRPASLSSRLLFAGRRWLRTPLHQLRSIWRPATDRAEAA